jgi:hypothetical protein
MLRLVRVTLRRFRLNLKACFGLRVGNYRVFFDETADTVTIHRVHERRPMNDPRKRAHELIDQLPETQLSALVGLLETIVDPVGAALRNAPLDDEPESDDEKQAVAEARDWLSSHGGKGIPHEEAMRKFGLE